MPAKQLSRTCREVFFYSYSYKWRHLWRPRSSIPAKAFCLMGDIISNHKNEIFWKSFKKNEQRTQL